MKILASFTKPHTKEVKADRPAIFRKLMIDGLLPVVGASGKAMQKHHRLPCARVDVRHVRVEYRHTLPREGISGGGRVKGNPKGRGR